VPLAGAFGEGLAHHALGGLSLLEGARQSCHS
jgi:hypothetical protein